MVLAAQSLIGGGHRAVPLAAEVLAVIAALLHVAFFYLESLAFTKPSTWRIFGVASQADADVIRPMALNQGFYNLFLAAGAIAGVIVGRLTASYGVWVTTVIDDKPDIPDPVLPPDFPTQYDQIGLGIVLVTLACMVGAALVLLISSRGRLARGAAIQGLAPLAALVVIVAT
jgi:putative membrane protein